MRDPARIDKFCAQLAKTWHRVPDWRFGQLMSNMLGDFCAKTRMDIFYPEDDTLLEFIKDYMKEER